MVCGKKRAVQSALSKTLSKAGVRSLRQGTLYLEKSNDGFEAWKGVKDWMALHNTNRPFLRLIGERRTRHTGMVATSSMKPKPDTPWKHCETV